MGEWNLIKAVINNKSIRFFFCSFFFVIQQKQKEPQQAFQNSNIYIFWYKPHWDFRKTYIFAYRKTKIKKIKKNNGALHKRTFDMCLGMGWSVVLVKLQNNLKGSLIAIGHTVGNVQSQKNRKVQWKTKQIVQSQINRFKYAHCKYF